MKRKALLITFAVAVPVFLLTRVIWPDPPGPPSAGPTGLQLALLIFLSVADAISFGFGVAFLVMGWPAVTQAPKEKKTLVWANYLAVTWLFVSWWPHTNLHRTMGDDLWMLIKVDYGFHITLMAAAFVVAMSALHGVLSHSHAPTPPKPSAVRQ